jgi:hypothetical protein
MKRPAVICLLACLMSLAGMPAAFGDGAAAQAAADQPAATPLAALPRVSWNGTRVVLLMIDGLAVKPYQQALAAGRLPHIERLLESRPAVSGLALATFPSATSPSVPELLSGRYAEIDTLDEPGAVHSFDRVERRVIRYVTRPDAWQWPVPNLFDATRGMPALTVFEGRWDGPKSVLTHFNVATQAALELVGAGALASGDRGPVEAFLDEILGDTPPVVSLVVFNEFDMIAHFHGPDSPQARDALANIDALIGEILDALDSRTGPNAIPFLDRTALLVFGDHGMVPSGSFVDLQRWFEDRGFDAVDVSTVPHVLFRERLGTWWTEWPDVILVSGGSNITQVYLRQLSGQWERADAARRPGDAVEEDTRVSRIADRLIGLEGVAQVIWMDRGGITHVHDRDGEAHIYVQGHDNARTFAYTAPPAAREDPFGYLGNPATAALVCRTDPPPADCFHPRVEWQDRTLDSRYPGAVALVPKAFNPQRYTGDLMVTAKPGYSFLRDQKGDHGNLERGAMLTPLIISGPGVRSRPEAHAMRLVDIYPTVAVLLGAKADDPAFSGLDGRVLDCVRGSP